MAFGVTHIVPSFAAAGGSGSNQKYGFTAGTYVGSGAATAAIVNSGLGQVHFVWMAKNFGSRTAGATTDCAVHPTPCLAVGTPGSFYPLVGFVDKGGAVNHALGSGAAATWSWLALGRYPDNV